MDTPTLRHNHESRDAHGFPSTPWSTVLAAKDVVEERRYAAVEKLCHRYEPAVRRVFQKITANSAEVDDLVQGFFAEKFLRPQFFTYLERDGGRFREFLKQCLRNYQRTHWRKNSRKLQHEVLVPQPPAEVAEEHAGPELHLDREWAEAIVERAREALAAEAEAGGQAELCRFFEAQLDGVSNLPAYAELARRLSKTENALTVALHRMRARYEWLLTQEIQSTLADPSRWQEEREYLLRVLEQSPTQ